MMLVRQLPCGISIRINMLFPTNLSVLFCCVQRWKVGIARPSQTNWTIPTDSIPPSPRASDPLQQESCRLSPVHHARKKAGYVAPLHQQGRVPLPGSDLRIFGIVEMGAQANLARPAARGPRASSGRTRVCRRRTPGLGAPHLGRGEAGGSGPFQAIGPEGASGLSEWAPCISAGLFALSLSD